MGGTSAVTAMLTLVALLAAADVPPVDGAERWVRELARPSEATEVVFARGRVHEVDGAVLSFRMPIPDSYSDPAMQFYGEAFTRAGWIVCVPPGREAEYYRSGYDGGPVVFDRGSWYSVGEGLMVIIDATQWAQSGQSRRDVVRFEKVEVWALPLSLDLRRAVCSPIVLFEPEWIDTPLWSPPGETR